MRKVCLYICMICAFCLFLLLAGCQKENEQEEQIISQAKDLVAEKQYPQAIGILSKIDDNEEAEDLIEQLRYVISADYLENLEAGVAAIDREGHIQYALSEGDYTWQDYTKVEEWQNICLLTGSSWGLDALDRDGCFYTVRGREQAVDFTERNKRIVRWEPIRLLSTNYLEHAAVVGEGEFDVYWEFSDYLNQEEISRETAGWTDVVDIAGREDKLAVLHRDGTVSLLCNNVDPSRDADMLEWTDIVAIDSAGECVAGLKSDGTVVVSHYGIGNMTNYYKATEWSDIIAISMGYRCLLGLKADGTVVAAGDHTSEQLEVLEWTDIVAIAAGQDMHVGLKADGTVVVAGKLQQDNPLPDISHMQNLYTPEIIFTK